VIDGDMEGLGIGNLRGRNPVGPNELSLGIRTAEALGLDVGSRTRLQLLGMPFTMNVVGVFQSVDNGGRGFRVRLPAVRASNPLWEPSQYSVTLVPRTNREDFIAALEAEYGESVDATPGDALVRDQLATIMAVLRLANGFLTLVFLTAAGVFIVNTTLLAIAEQRRVLGLLKTTGMTPAQLRYSIVAGVGVQSACAVLAGMVLWFLTARAALSRVFAGVGLAEFPLEHWALGMSIAMPAVVLFCLAIAWWPSRHVLALSPRSLIVE
jgi:putative ABC transport system permease protein